MAVQTISAFPATPSRLGDPTNFFAESLAFLAAQPTFVSQCNTLAGQLNAFKFNVNDWGLITTTPSGGGGSNVTNFPNAAPTGLTGLDLIGSLDSLLASLSSFVADANTVATYIDALDDPAAPVVVDPSRPNIPSVSASQTRTDAQATFNSKATAFHNSARTFAYALNDLSNYVTSYLSGTDDWSTITAAITATDDWGSIV